MAGKVKCSPRIGCTSLKSPLNFMIVRAVGTFARTMFYKDYAAAGSAPANTLGGDEEAY